MALPLPEAEAQAHSDRLSALIADQIRQAGGWISFARYLELVLYAPGLGYYSAGSRKFGAAGDFVTAPEMTPLFGRAVARQVAEIMAQSAPEIIEAGAGTGLLAADLLLALEALGCAPERYRILDLSADLTERQRNTIATRAPHLLPRVEWLDRLPERFSGILIGNEVLDAMPAHLVVWGQPPRERGVALALGAGQARAFVYADRPLDATLTAEVALLEKTCQPAQGYQSEISLANRAWVGELSRRLDCGAILLFDYGFPRHEYYHPQRSGGTLMCHYRHHAHGDPFYLPGLQDVTVHVDFTSIAEAAFDQGLSVLGYTAQSHFLLNCGLLDLLDATTDPVHRAREASAVHKLISPSEMGELFKVIALGKGIAEPLLGFGQGDRTHTL
jgi:SAM-dependent MidA family methyltransferase